MGDVKVASVSPAVAPLAAAAASSSTASAASVPVEMAAAVAVCDAAEERVADEHQSAEADAVAETEAKKEAVEATEAVIQSEKPLDEETKQAVEGAHVPSPAESYAQCNGAVSGTMENTTLANNEEVVVVATAQSNGTPERLEAAAEADTEAGFVASGEGEGERDGVAVAPASPGAMKLTSPSISEEKAKAAACEDKHEDEEELVATTSVEEQSPEVICLDGDTQEEGDDEDDGADTVGSELSAVDETSESLQTQQTPVRQRRKRARVLGFSNNRRANHVKQKRLSVATAAEEEVIVAPPTRARRQQSAESLAEAAIANDAAPAAAPATTEVVTWNWNSCSVYFDPLTQASMDELSTLRREHAQVVATNVHLWSKMRCLDNDESYLAGIIVDAGASTDEDLNRLRFRPVNRGRSYRDAWEEEDFLLNQRKPAAIGRASSKKRPFAGCEAVSSYRKLVRGFDDDLFGKYTQHLETSARCKADIEKNESQGGISAERIENSPPRRLKSTKRPAKDLDTLPPVPSSTLHPASCGSWKFKGKEAPSFDSIHPAAIRSASLPQRWVEEMERTTKQDVVVDESDERPRRSGRREMNKQGDDEDTDEGEETKAEAVDDDHSTDELVELPSFGSVVDEDEVSHEINNSILRLLEVSALNWRRAQAVYERAVAHIEVTPLLLGEEASKLRLETMYRSIFPPVAEDQDDMEDAAPRELKLMSKPKDIVAYAVKPCSDVHEAVAVGTSVEYAVRLKKGDAIDVLDRNGCWNDGVVIDLRMEAGVGLKFVRVSYALWGDDSSEWVSIADGRVLPRGVADGRVTFSFAASSIRKKRVEMNKSLADLLQRTYPIRMSARVHLNGAKEEAVKPLSKKQRRQR